MSKPSSRHCRRNPIGLFEENYRLLLTLLSDWEEGEHSVRLVGSNGTAPLKLTLLEQAPYTTMLALRMPFSSGGLHLPQLRMELRLYHDAQVAEVTAYQGCQRIPAPYQVNGSGRWHLDEKRQVNLLLHELLRYCQRNGYQLLMEQDCP